MTSFQLKGNFCVWPFSSRCGRRPRASKISFRFVGCFLGGEQESSDQCFSHFRFGRGASVSVCGPAWHILMFHMTMGERYNNSLLTPRDWTSHFVLHRALITRSVTTQESCRCCGYARENLQHFPTCSACACIFEDMRKLAELPELQSETERERFGLFALHPQKKIERGWINCTS